MDMNDGCAGGVFPGDLDRERAATQVLAPRFGRMLTWTLAGAGVNDFLQASFVALSGNANELER